MFCSKCGKEIEDNVRFCSNCGNTIGVEQSETNLDVAKSRKINNKLPVILGICAVVIILIAVSVSTLNNKETSLTNILHHELSKETVAEEAVQGAEEIREEAVQGAEEIREEAVQGAEEVVADNEIADLAQAIEDERLQKVSALESAYFDFFEAKNEALGREVSEGLYYCYEDLNMDLIREIFYVNLEEKKCYLVYTVPNEDGSYTAKEQYICDAHSDNIFHNTFKEKPILSYYPVLGVVHTAPREIDIQNDIAGLINKDTSFFNYLVFRYTGSDLQKVYADIDYRNGELGDMDASITTNLADYFEASLSDSYNSKMRWDGNEDSWIRLSDTDLDKFTQLMNEWFCSGCLPREVKGSNFQYSADAFMEIAYDFNRNGVPILY